MIMTHSTGTLIAIMVAAGLLPFALVMLTSFVKMAVVLSIVRSAMGVPQVPPNSVVTGLALVLSMVVMAPVAYEVGNHILEAESVLENGSISEIFDVVTKASEPIERFLRRHSHPEHVQAFAGVLGAGAGQENAGWKILVPSFVVSQLHEAFRMGFVIFLPFLVLDMLIASILLSLGMHMLSPTTISLPFKLLLFVFAEGWTLIGTNLLGSYL
jgi:type III secretion protein R